MKKSISIIIIILGIILIIGGFIIHDYPCKKLGFDGKYGNSEMCYNRITAEDGTIILESSIGILPAKESIIYYIMLMSGILVITFAIVIGVKK